MRHAGSFRWNVTEALAVAAVLIAWPAVGAAQLLGAIAGITTAPASVVGQAAAVRATAAALPGGSTALADAGTLSGTGDAREASLGTGGIASALTAATLH